MRKSVITFAAAAALSLGLAACVAEPSPQLRDDPNFSAGYNDGCRTANSRISGFKSTVYRNEELFDSSEAYQAGWKEGYGTCGGATEQRKPGQVFDEDQWYSPGI